MSRCPCPRRLEVDRRRLERRHPDTQRDPAGLEPRHRLGEQRAADVVEHGVHGRHAGERVRHLGSAQRARTLWPAARSDHDRAGSRGELDREPAYAARRAGYEHTAAQHAAEAPDGA